MSLRRFLLNSFDFIHSLWIRTLLFLSQPLFARLLADPYTEAGHVREKVRAAHHSRVTMTEVILPNHCNVRGLAYAGTIMSWIDVAAGISAKRHASSPSVTRSVDDVAFLHPVKVGDILTIQATVNKSWKTSMEVGVKVEAETPLTGERFFVAHAYLTFVALSPRPVPRTYLGRIINEHHPIRVPEVVPHSVAEKKRYEMAEKRRQRRLGQGKPKLDDIRQLMQSWSQGLREQSNTADAKIRRHPAFDHTKLEQEQDESDPPHIVVEMSSGEDSNVDEEQSVRRSKRYSTDPSLMPVCIEKPMSDTFAEVVELVMPQHANTLSIAFGGQIMAWMEACVLTSANRLTRAYLLTASIDSLQFITPTRVGDVITIRSIVSRSYTSSMEVYVSVEAENLQTGETHFTNDAFFTIVAIDADHIPVRIPRTIPHVEAEIRLNEGGKERRKKRLRQRAELVNLVSENASTATTSTIAISPSELV